MRIAVLSGKGGTGKTFVSTNLVSSVEDLSYVDCDVEEPNGYLFLKPEDVLEKDIRVSIPEVDKDKCDGCRECVDFCKFNALAHTGKKLLILEELCHSCGGCILFCDRQALSKKEHTIGRIEKGKLGERNIITGIMNIGESSGTPIIESLMEELGEDEDAVIDCPPGSACTVMDSIRDVDYCILVVEPTIFGLENFKMVEDLVRMYEKPFGVVINKYYEEENMARKYCLDNDIEILLEIPHNREIGKYNSQGLIVSDYDKAYRDLFIELFQGIKGRFSV